MHRGHLVICGHGPGIGHSTARRFAQAGFGVTIVGRNQARLETAASELVAEGHQVKSVAADLSNPASVEGAIARARDAGGPLTTLHWNAIYPGAGNLLEASFDELGAISGLALLGPLAALRASLNDLQSSEIGSLLLTGGGLAGDAGDALAVNYSMAGIALGKAIHRKLTRLLALSLEGTGVYVGELAVLGMVRSSANPGGTVAPDDIASRLFEMQRERSGIHHQITGG